MRCTVKEGQSPDCPASSKTAAPCFAHGENRLVSFKHEKLLARETGAVFVLVGGFYRRPWNELDGSSQLHGAK